MTIAIDISSSVSTFGSGCFAVEGISTPASPQARPASDAIKIADFIE